jgi:hypothetical protein
MNLLEKKFYHLFWTDNTCSEIFSKHKSQLLEDEVELILSKEKFYAQRIVLTNSYKQNKNTYLQKRIEGKEIELVHEFRLSFEKHLNFDQLEAFLKKKFGRTIKKVEKEIEKGGIKLLISILTSISSEEGTIKFLKSYYLIPKEIDSLDKLTRYIEEEFRKYIKEFLNKRNLSELALSIDLVSSYYNNKIKTNLLDSIKHYTTVLYDTDNFNSRVDFFDHLYEIKVLNGGKLKGTYECIHCPTNTFNSIVTTDIKPSKLKLNCPNCRKELLYIIPYELDGTIYQHIISQDGILFHALQYLLEENNYSFLINQKYLQDVEIDICVTNNSKIVELIEVKMFKTDRPSDTQISNLRQAISQMKEIIKKLIEIDPNFQTIKHSIVTNISDNKIIQSAKTELTNDLREYNINIFSVHDYYNNISSS